MNIKFKTIPGESLPARRRRIGLDVAQLLDSNPLLRDEVAALLDVPSNLLKFDGPPAPEDDSEEFDDYTE